MTYEALFLFIVDQFSSTVKLGEKICYRVCNHNQQRYHLKRHQVGHDVGDVFFKAYLLFFLSSEKEYSFLYLENDKGNDPRGSNLLYRIWSLKLENDRISGTIRQWWGVEHNQKIKKCRRAQETEKKTGARHSIRNVNFRQPNNCICYSSGA